MRRDYFTCVFLGLIAGALFFVCFKPLYFTYEVIVPRDFSILERLLSALYTIFFVLFLPCFAAFKKKEWINWGLACYGLMAYLPLWFYPTEAMAETGDPSLFTSLGALSLRAIYAVVEAPFAALSKLMGDSAASKIAYWIMPIAILWPVLFRIIRFYRRAYLSEQLNPMPNDQTAPVTTAPEAPEKPEVLGTVISAPVTAKTPADITRKSFHAKQRSETSRIPASDSAEKPAMKEGRSVRHAAVRAPVRPAFEGVPAPEKTEKPGLASGPSGDKAETEKVIPMGAPKPKSDEAIPLGAPMPKPDEAIPLGAPMQKSNEAIPLGGPATKA